MTTLTETDLPQTDRPNLLSRAWAWFATLVIDMCGGDDVPADPTAQFTTQEWADLPTWHPASDDGK